MLRRERWECLTDRNELLWIGWLQKCQTYPLVQCFSQEYANEVCTACGLSERAMTEESQCTDLGGLHQRDFSIHGLSNNKQDPYSFAQPVKMVIAVGLKRSGVLQLHSCTKIRHWGCRTDRNELLLWVCWLPKSQTVSWSKRVTVVRWRNGPIQTKNPPDWGLSERAMTRSQHCTARRGLHQRIFLHVIGRRKSEELDVSFQIRTFYSFVPKIIWERWRRRNKFLSDWSLPSSD